MYVLFALQKLTSYRCAFMLLQQICFARGLNAKDLSREELVAYVERWTAVSKHVAGLCYLLCLVLIRYNKRVFVYIEQLKQVCCDVVCNVCVCRRLAVTSSPCSTLPRVHDVSQSEVLTQKGVVCGWQRWRQRWRQ